MRPITFNPAVLRRYLLRHQIAELPQLKRVLGTSVDLTVFRKLQHLGYLTSYSHRGRFYTLQEIARFDARGLWSHESVWFSRYGSLVDTVEAFVQASPNGYYAPELTDVLHVEVQEPLRHLVRQQHRLSRSAIGGRFLYTSMDSALRRRQTLARRSAQQLPVAVHSEALELSADELQAAILLFYGLLDEQQRRLFAGIESLRLGHGGDKLLAEFLGLDVHTVARGREQLLEQEVSLGRIRRIGGGRSRAEKKRRSDRTDSPSARARNGWGSDQGSEMAPPGYPENCPATPSAEDPRQRQHRTAVVETDGLLLASEPQEARIGEQELAAPTGAPSAVWLHRASAKTISGAGEPHHQHRCEKKGNDWKFQEPRGWLGEAAAAGHGSRLPQRRQRAWPSLMAFTIRRGIRVSWWWGPATRPRPLPSMPSLCGGRVTDRGCTAGPRSC